MKSLTFQFIPSNRHIELGIPALMRSIFGSMRSASFHPPVDVDTRLNCCIVLCDSICTDVLPLMHYINHLYEKHFVGVNCRSDIGQRKSLCIRISFLFTREFYVCLILRVRFMLMLCNYGTVPISLPHVEPAFHNTVRSTFLTIIKVTHKFTKISMQFNIFLSVCLVQTH